MLLWGMLLCSCPKFHRPALGLGEIPWPHPPHLKTRAGQKTKAHQGTAAGRASCGGALGPWPWAWRSSSSAKRSPWALLVCCSRASKQAPKTQNPSEHPHISPCRLCSGIAGVAAQCDAPRQRQLLQPPCPFQHPSMRLPQAMRMDQLNTRVPK